MMLLVWCHAEATGKQMTNLASSHAGGRIDPVSFGALGDGAADDTEAFQKALSYCSQRGVTCLVPSGKKFLVKAPLYIWGKANLLGDDLGGSIIFENLESPYLINVGISGPQQFEQPFSGSISGITFKVVGGKGGRTLFFWRTEGAIIHRNRFDFGPYRYSATSSGNDNAVVANGFVNCIRKNITISDNVIDATADYDGSEGIGLGHFDGARITNNKITGVGDDPIGIHFSKDVQILNNDLKSVDGRLFVVNSRHVTIANNRHERTRSVKDGKFYTGISLLYIGFETLESSNYSAPTDIQIRENTLYYPEGSIDQGAAIYLYGTRDVIIENNGIVNDSAAVTATAIRVLPAIFKRRWKDPDGIDPSNVARVHKTLILANTSMGKHPLAIGMSGNCDDFPGELTVKNNTASDYNLYCNHVQAYGNKRTNLPR